MILDHVQLAQYERLKNKQKSVEGLDELEAAALEALHIKYRKHILHLKQYQKLKND
jgi:hypothetical protein